MYVTYQDLIQIGILIVALVNLIYYLCIFLECRMDTHSTG